MQDHASAQPLFTRWQKAGIGAVAVAGWIGFQFVLMLPWCLVLALNALWFRNAYFSGGTVVVALTLWWLLQPGRAAPDRVVRRAEAPVLYQMLDELAVRIQAPRIDEVHLDDEFNAGALQRRWRWQPWRTQRVLVLGVPLLAVMNTEGVRAVVAHELGHFSHRHGRLGHWVYRTRLGWLALMEAGEGKASLLDRGTNRFAQWFGPWFARWSFAYSRSCEYEADAFAAAAVGPEAMAASLVSVEARSRRFQAFLSGTLTQRRQALTALPPTRVTADIRAFMLSTPLGEDDLKQARHDATQEADTHPVLVDRLRALGLSVEQGLAHATAQTGSTAGEAWLASWSEVVLAHDAEWLLRNGRTWQREHIRCRLQAERLAVLQTNAAVSLERARLELAVGAVPNAIDVATQYRVAEPENAEAAYWLGSALAAAQDASACEILEDCVRIDPSWAAAARTVLATEASRFLNEDQRERNDVLLQRAVRRRELALDQMCTEVEAGRIEPCVIDPLGASILKESLAGVEPLRSAWLMRKSDVRVGDRRFDGVILLMRIAPADMHARALTEDDVVAEGLQLLRSVVPLNVLRQVWTSFTTEPMPPALEATLAAHPASCLTT